MADDLVETSLSEDRAKLDATGEFFSVGVPLHAVRAGYIKRRADDQLFDIVARGRYAHVLAPSRSGKSSLVAATAARLEGSGCKVVILDLEQIGERDSGSDSGRWYYSVAYRLQRQLRIRFNLQDWWQDKSVLSNRQRLVAFFTEVVLEFVSERIVVFVDQIQCIEDVPYADQLLVSIRAAHNARITDPEFNRLSFVLLGECDPVSLVEEAELSPFNVTEPVVLDDFTRSEINLFATELNMPEGRAARALDRVFYWTNGQPYLSQKLARAVSRAQPEDDLEAQVDRLAMQQLGGRAALHNEPHMSHIHRVVVNEEKRREGLLNLYGKRRKGVKVAADLGSALQRRLMAVGLLVIDDEGDLAVRNRLYESVFTARWANDNLPTKLRVPAMVAAGILLFALIPFWYTQWLPGPYVRALVDDETVLETAVEAHENFRSFPGHTATADNLYRRFLERRALASIDAEEIGVLAALAADLPESGLLADDLVARFWDRRTLAAMRSEDRDAALLASIQSLVVSSGARRQRAASLLSDDYPLLLETLPSLPVGASVFDPENRTVSTAIGATISQLSYTSQGLEYRDPWSITALEVIPLLRRVAVDRDGVVSRIGLTLNLSHTRLGDLRIKVIAPSGRAVDVRPDAEKASSSDNLRITAQQLTPLLGESLNGTWSISVRDERMGVAGQLVGWTLQLNSQGAVEHFERGMNIPDPLEREADSVWFDSSGRYAVARATQSDSARVWDLAIAKPVRAVAVAENETLIGLSENAESLVTATQDSVNIWEIATGDKLTTLPVGAASTTSAITADGSHLFAANRGDVETELALWSLKSETKESRIVVAGAPALVTVDAAGERVAVADYDRAVRVWDFNNGELVTQVDLLAQPDRIALSADGQTLAVQYPGFGVSVWAVATAAQPLLEETGSGAWQFAFSPSGSAIAVGRSQVGYQIHKTSTGQIVGPTFGLGSGGDSATLLSFSADEQIVISGGQESPLRLWRAPGLADTDVANAALHNIWNVSGDQVAMASRDGGKIAIGDREGHVHVVSTDTVSARVEALTDDLSFLGHRSAVRELEFDDDGQFVASAANDNTVRVWRSEGGAPLPYIVNVEGSIVRALRFAPDASVLAVVHGNRVTLLDVQSGERQGTLTFGTPVNDVAFLHAGRLYVGGSDGSLRLSSRGPDNVWQSQQVWQGVPAIELLQISPRGDILVIVDGDRRASLFNLAEERLAITDLVFPSAVHEVAFDNSGTKAYFRTARWVHRINSSASGLHWVNAWFAPKSLRGGGLVLGNAGNVDSPSGVFLPTARNGYIELLNLDYRHSGIGGLMGRREALAEEWRSRVSAVPHATF